MNTENEFNTFLVGVGTGILVPGKVLVLGPKTVGTVGTSPGTDDDKFLLSAVDGLLDETAVDRSLALALVVEVALAVGPAKIDLLFLVTILSFEEFAVGS